MSAKTYFQKALSEFRNLDLTSKKDIDQRYIDAGRVEEGNTVTFWTHSLNNFYGKDELANKLDKLVNTLCEKDKKNHIYRAYTHDQFSILTELVEKETSIPEKCRRVAVNNARNTLWGNHDHQQTLRQMRNLTIEELNYFADATDDMEVKKYIYNRFVEVCCNTQGRYTTFEDLKRLKNVIAALTKLRELATTSQERLNICQNMRRVYSDQISLVDSLSKFNDEDDPEYKLAKDEATNGIKALEKEEAKLNKEILQNLSDSLANSSVVDLAPGQNLMPSNPCDKYKENVSKCIAPKVSHYSQNGYSWFTSTLDERQTGKVKAINNIHSILNQPHNNPSQLLYKMEQYLSQENDPDVKKLKETSEVYKLWGSQYSTTFTNLLEYTIQLRNDLQKTQALNPTTPAFKNLIRDASLESKVVNQTSISNSSASKNPMFTQYNNNNNNNNNSNNSNNSNKFGGSMLS